jgi:hypothetical protein
MTNMSAQQPLLAGEEEMKLASIFPAVLTWLCSSRAVAAAQVATRTIDSATNA